MDASFVPEHFPTPQTDLTPLVPLSPRRTALRQVAASSAPSPQSSSRPQGEETGGVSGVSHSLQRVRHGTGSGDFCVLAGSASTLLAEDVARRLSMRLTRLVTSAFADGEVGIKVLDNVRSKECFVIQSTAPPVNDNLVELCLIADALKRAACKRITAIIPYYGYARQDRKTRPRVPISAALMARLIQSSGVDHVFAVDLHCGQIQGFFDCPVDNLYGSIVLKDYFLQESFADLKMVVVSPDAGGVERADSFRQYLDRKGLKSEFAVMNKRRHVPNQIASMELVGSVEGCVAIIVDDIIDTAGTLCCAANVLVENGASQVYAVASHGIFSEPAHERIDESVLTKVIILNTITPRPGVNISHKIETLSIGPMLATAIAHSAEGRSLAELFD